MRKYTTLIARILLIAFVNQFIYPVVSRASTGGPTSPDFSTFEPITTANMVDGFTGALSYNIPVIEVPGPDGGSYALSLSYHSGSSPDQEASWVGYGWALNPGSISRNIRGVADDAKKADVIHYNQMTANWTAGIGASYGFQGLELFGVDIPLNLSLTSQLQYNNYKGLSFITTPYVGFTLGMFSLGYTFEESDKGSFSYSVNPGALLADGMKKNTEAENEAKLQSEKYGNCLPKNNRDRMQKALGGSQYISSSYNTYTRPTTTSSYTGVSARFNLSGQVDVSFLPAGSECATVFGTFAMQSPTTEETLNHYGYLYSADAGDEDIMDYAIEKETPYKKRNFFLSIPYSQPDIYSVSGEGLGGSFRFHSRYAGHFHTNTKKSETFSGQLGLELEAGMNIGPGGDIGASYNSLEVSGYGDDDYTFQSDGDEPFFAAFDGDNAMYMDFGSESAVRADMDQNNSVPGLMEYEFKVSGDIEKQSSEDRVMRSSNIVYHTNDEMTKADCGSHVYNSYSQRDSTEQWIDRTDAEISDGIGEFVVYNTDGLRYTYGLPVYSRNEMNLQFGVPANDANVTLEHNYIAYKSNIDTDNSLKKIGTEDPNVYASNYLLTEIVTPHYIDRTWDGPSSDDFGGYVKFNYRQQYGNDAGTKSGGDWYQWRIPYSGTIYNKGVMSDTRDDMGFVSTGQKEIYYTSSIETKTHIAYFYTSDRNDGVEAIDASTSTEAGFYDAIKSDYFNSSFYSSADKLQKLDSVCLHVKKSDGSAGEKLKRVYFEYDYSVWPGQPNTISSSDGTGKLTLKHVWVEGEDVYNAKVRPYTFEYSYPTSGTYPTKYASLDDYGTTLDQDPSYSNFLGDRWGCYQENGEDRYDNMLQWVDQTPNSNTFDPAAWQLKQIKLPTGGEMHVQYEQNDYRYVQDRLAMAMAPLKETSSVTGIAGDVYQLNLDSLGLSSIDYSDVENLIQQEFINKEEKIYFKFLYGFLGTATPTIADCNSEYISGYVNVEDVWSDASGVYVKLGTSDEDEYTNPREVCINNYYANHNGADFTTCDMDQFSISDVESFLYEMLEEMSDPFEISGENECLTVNETLSYLRIPILENKKGGGIRVKRLMMFDEGIEGDAVLYGKEYIYQNEDGLSSGVATNEPESGGDENALCTYLKVSADQDWAERAIAGEDKEQSEGPVGKNILQGASVGYSRVVIKNIFDGINNDGFTVNQFYTVKDYPFDGTWTYTDENGDVQYLHGVDYTSIDQEQDWFPVYALLVNTFVSNLWLTQGYSFTKNNMHGQSKSAATYTGSYDYVNEPSKTQLVAMKETQYYQPGEPVNIMTEWNNIEKRVAGKEMEVVFESRSIKDQTTDASAEFDVSVGFIPLPPFSIPFITLIPSLSYIEQELYTHVTTTINSYSALPKNVRTYHDGVWTYAENEIFDANTFSPLIVKSADDFNGLQLGSSSAEHQGYYYSYSFPAAHQYDEMARKCIGDGFTVNTADYTDLEIYYMYDGSNMITFLGDICSFADKFSPGDFLAVTFSSGSTYFYQSNGLNGINMEIYPVEGFVSIPTAYSGDGISTLSIVRSGRSNQLSTSVGSLMQYTDAKTDDNNFADYKSVKSVDSDYITEWNDRKIFAASLSTQLNSGSTAIKTYTSSKINIENSGSGSCDPMSGLQVQFIAQGDTLVQMRVNDNCIEYIVPGGYFSMDEDCGKLIYYNPGAECSPTTIECIVFCPGIYPVERMDDVITASASGFTDEWALDNTIASYFDIDMSTVVNPYTVAEDGKWKAKTGNIYKEDISSITDAGGRIYNSGIFTDSLALYNWLYEEANNDSLWITNVTQTMYSPYGSALETEDILEIKSISKKGYGLTVPYLTAVNAAYQSVLFESFENTTDDGSYLYCEDGFSLNMGATYFGGLAGDTAHSGNSSYRMAMQDVSTTVTIPAIPPMPSFTLTLFGYDTSSLDLRGIPLDDQIAQDGLTVKLWLKVEGSDEEVSEFNLSVDNASYPVRNKLISFSKLARVGEWTLYEAKTGKFSSSFWSGSVTPVVQVKHETMGVKIYLDDLRIQPTTTQMTAYVYDPATLRILTELDDQHFAKNFQYNQEGKLVRKIRETERGVKTVQETQYNVPNQSRP